MNYVPIHALRIMAVESGLLLAAWVAFLVLRPVLSSVSRPRWLNRALARNPRAVLLVTVLALAGRAMILPFAWVPHPRVNDE